MIEDDLELAEEDLTGIGLTAEEIARSPVFGSWGTEDGQSGTEYVEELGRGGYSW